MPKKALTDRFVKGAKPKGGKWIEYWDTKEPGLLLIVSPKSHRSYAFRYRRPSDGKKRKITIGPAGDTTLSEARTAAASYRSMVRAKEDPAQVIRATQASDHDRTFKELSDLYIERYAKLNKRSWRADERSLDRDVLPAIGDLTVGDIKKRDVLDIIDTVADRGSPIMANRTLAVVRGVFRWAEAEDLIEVAPIHGIRPRAIEQARDRVLNDQEIRTFLSKLDTPKIKPKVRDIMRLVLILGQRVSEVAGAKKEELNLEKGEWIIPGERTKNGKLHNVPLPAMAVDVLMRNINSEESFIFPSYGKLGHIHPHAPARALYREQKHFGLDQFTVHDLRRTAASGMAELGVDRIVIGKVLNHVSVDKDTVTGVYDRYAYAAEKRGALENWAAKLDKILAAMPAPSSNQQ